MIISHKHRYLFVELPRTGTTAISKELRTHYDGVRILHKHATYQEFLKIATPEEKTYFVFSCVRNPLDDAVSRYFKTKTDHRGWYSGRGKSKLRNVVRFVDWLGYKFVQITHADFPRFFRVFHILPYSNWSILSHKSFDYVIRFENLQPDFETALRLIGIEPVRPLPVSNRTASKDSDFLKYYTPEIIGQAKRVFGPYMRFWGYEFPPQWGGSDETIPWWHQAQYDLANLFKRQYWLHLRGRI